MLSEIGKTLSVIAAVGGVAVVAAFAAAVGWKTGVVAADVGLVLGARGAEKIMNKFSKKTEEEAA